MPNTGQNEFPPEEASHTLFEEIREIANTACDHLTDNTVALKKDFEREIDNMVAKSVLPPTEKEMLRQFSERVKKSVRDKIEAATHLSVDSIRDMAKQPFR